MKITVITGSPRKKGNTFAMTDAFIKAAEAKGHEVVRFDAAMMKIGGCHACMTCYKTGKSCSFDDDFNLIAPHILDADAVVYAMPVYWFSIPSQIKGVIDRVYSMMVAGKKIAGKKMGLLCCCADTTMKSIEGVKRPMELTAACLKWDYAGDALALGVYDEGDIEKTDGCARAAALAEKL